jgi:hypothetical protein
LIDLKNSIGGGTYEKELSIFCSSWVSGSFPWWSFLWLAGKDGGDRRIEYHIKAYR